MARIFQINESGITHIEDLDLEKFLSAVDNLAKFDASEKMDGSELVMGLDNDGELYTTRDLKGGSKGLVYKASEYFHNGGGPTFATAHTAILKMAHKFQHVMEPGEAVEVEVIFGRQPNSIVYGKDGYNYITFLKPVPGTNEELPLRKDLPQELAASLKGRIATITTKMPESDDGINIRQVDTTTNWKFTKTQSIDTTKIDDVDVKEELRKLKEYLQDANEVASDDGLQLSNFEVAILNLSKIPPDKREKLKKERDQVNVKILSDFKLPIKDKLLKNFNKSVKPELQGDVSDNEVGGIEGVVFVDPQTHETFKLVDKETFTSINQFNYQIRKKLSGIVRTIDPEASLESRGGIVGVLRFRIMSLLGIPEATRTYTLKKILSKFDGETPEETIDKFAQGFKEINVNAYRHKITAMIEATIEEINDTLTDFKKNNKNYKLTLKSGKEIGYTDEIVRRTLLTFAEIRERLEKLKTNVSQVRSTRELIDVIVGNVADQIHESVLTESVSEEKLNNFMWLSKLDTDDVIKAYVFNYIAALTLVRLNDKKAMSALRDSINGSLSSFGKSHLNQLGFILFHPGESTKCLKSGVARSLERIAGRVLSDRRKKIHGPISSNQNGKLDWSQVDDNLRILSLRLELYDDVIPLARAVLRNWYSATLDDKNALLSKAFYRIQGIDPQSPYTAFLRSALNNFLTHANKENQMLIKEIFKITEERELQEMGGGGGGAGGGTGAGAVGSGAAPGMGAGSTPGGGIGTYGGSEVSLALSGGAATSVTSIASYPAKLFKGKVIRRVSRTVQKRKKFGKKKSSII